MAAVDAEVDVEETAKVPLWNDPRVRALLSQAVLILAVIWVGYEIISNTMQNLERQNIASGFGFLNNTAGFGIIQTLIPYSEQSTYGRAFLVGLFNTLLVAAIGVFMATIIGFFVGICRLSKNWVIAKLAAVYVETFRNIPLLLQIFFWYFAVLRAVPGRREKVSFFFDSFHLNIAGFRTPAPVFTDGWGVVGIALLLGIAAAFLVRRWAKKRQAATGEQFPVFLTSLGLILLLPLLTYFVMGRPIGIEFPVFLEEGPILKRGFQEGIGFVMIPEFLALLLALAIYTASFIAEIVRAGILAVSHGQTEAAYALGLRPQQTLRLVIIPQALRVIIPPLTSQYLNLTKNSSLAVAIAYPDLVSVFAGIVLNQSGQAVEIILITMGVYLTISVITSLLMNWYNASVALVER